MTNTTIADQLSEAELGRLRSLAGLMIPEDADIGMPGADDPAIFTMMVDSIGRDFDEVRKTLGLMAAAIATHSPPMSDEDLAEAVSEMKKEKPAAFAVIEAVVARAYYRDMRVLKALGIMPRPPFPDGFLVEETDWSVLDPVRSRGPIWRKTEE